MLITRMTLAASSASGSAEYLFARTRQASASSAYSSGKYSNPNELYLGTLKVNRVHGGALEEFYFCEMTFEHSFQFQIGWNAGIIVFISFLVEN